MAKLADCIRRPRISEEKSGKAGCLKYVLPLHYITRLEVNFTLSIIDAISY